VIFLAKTTTIIKQLKPGGFVLIDDVPCRVDKVQTSSTGKHGHSKVRIEAIGLLDGTRRSIVKPADENVDVPIIIKKTAQILAIMGDNVQLMDMETYEVFELPIPEEMKEKVEAGKEISYFEVMEQKTIKQIK
jgi:translation initiation factor 5A